METEGGRPEPRDVPMTVRLTQTCAATVKALALKEDRKPADMLRLLIQDGCKMRLSRESAN